MTIAFFIMALIAVVSALAVVLLHNPIYSALALVTNLLCVAAVFALLDAHFLSVVQIIVYAGAIVVLVLFVLMLLNIKLEAARKYSNFYIAAAALAGVAFLATILPLAQQAFSVFPDPNSSLEGTVENMGVSLYTKYVFPFEAASVLIMVAIVGAVMLAKRNYRMIK